MISIKVKFIDERRLCHIASQVFYCVYREAAGSAFEKYKIYEKSKKKIYDIGLTLVDLCSWCHGIT